MTTPEPTPLREALHAIWIMAGGGQDDDHDQVAVLADIEEQARAALATPSSPAQHYHDFENALCPNCVTPWKCNGPHLSDQVRCSCGIAFEEQAEATPPAARHANEGDDPRYLTPAPPAALDVERLARALTANWTLIRKKKWEAGGTPLEMARAIAAAYQQEGEPARLPFQEPT